jgi:hypothetical protein
LRPAEGVRAEPPPPPARMLLRSPNSRKSQVAGDSDRSRNRILLDASGRAATACRSAFAPIMSLD